VFTARTPGIARWAGTVSGVYCLFYGVAGALIGMAAHAILPGALESKDDAFATVVQATMPAVLGGLVLAAALAAVMSTSSGALIATATVFSQDIVQRLRGEPHDGDPEHIRSNRLYVAGFGIVMIVIACLLQDVVAALTVAYDILVGGLLVPILGGLLWRRGTNVGAIVAMAVGTIATLATMVIVGDIYANEPIYFGLAFGLVAYVIGSLATPRTSPDVLEEWDRRSRGAEEEPAPLPQ
jgi:solute:Na+ symporter, SSS family